jgi:hypothetical protein
LSLPRTTNSDPLNDSWTTQEPEEKVEVEALEGESGRRDEKVVE